MGSRLDDRITFRGQGSLCELMIRTTSVADWVQILRIRLYVLRNFDDEATSYGDKEDYGEHERIKKLYGKPHLEKLIELEVQNRRGRLLITSK